MISYEFLQKGDYVYMDITSGYIYKIIEFLSKSGLDGMDEFRIENSIGMIYRVPANNIERIVLSQKALNKIFEI